MDKTIVTISLNVYLEKTIDVIGLNDVSKAYGQNMIPIIGICEGSDTTLVITCNCKNMFL